MRYVTSKFAPQPALLNKPTNTVLELAKDLHRELISQVLVAFRSRMQIVARIILRCQLAGDFGVGKELVEVGDSIKRPRSADEAVDLLPVELSVSITAK